MKESRGGSVKEPPGYGTKPKGKPFEIIRCRRGKSDRLQLDRLPSPASSATKRPDRHHSPASFIACWYLSAIAPSTQTCW